MFPTAARLSKASRRPLTTKRGNKDYYKGTRQAVLPGGHRTGAPGRHVVRGKAKYRLLDEKVRVFVAPPILEIENSTLRPYVSTSVQLKESEKRAAFGKFREAGGLTPQHYLKMLRENAQQAKPKELMETDSSHSVSRLTGFMEKVGLR
ncbi:hypothetical protein E1B28_011440 [Marasmius oreades]|uniref:Mitochondrial ribosomal protein L41 n=1 Tax=Marasmius oreades TaxID=181124 RepID=A0A9P7RU44_9AGAR|nr:uncharacterized protein E1B28_011440 [Marasmius oreades]KAG7089789.1 hypothetical protein E1B28_011440 [Marasmius oreades]